MENFDILNILYFCLFSIFVHYQRIHVMIFRGESQIFQLILSFFAITGNIIGIVFLVIYGIKLVWWAPFLLFFLHLLQSLLRN